MTVVPRILRDLSGASNERFAVLLNEAMADAVTGAVLVRRAVAGEVASAAACEEMRVLEHHADDARHALVDELRGALVTPLDREDLNRVSRSIDDVTDYLRDFLRLWDAFEMTEAPLITPLCDAIIQALDDLAKAIEVLVSDPAAITTRALVAKKTGNAIRRAHDYQLAALYRLPFGVETLKVRDLLRRLDVVGIRFADAADVLTDAAYKRADS